MRMHKTADATYGAQRAEPMRGHKSAFRRLLTALLCRVTQILLPSADTRAPADRPQNERPTGVFSKQFTLSAIMLLDMLNEENKKRLEWKAIICELKAAAPLAKPSRMFSSYNWVGLPISAEKNEKIAGE